MFEIIGRWLIVFAFRYVVGKLYRMPAIFHFVERDSGRGTRVEYRSIYAKRNPKEILRTDAEDELNFLMSISIPEANIRILSHYSFPEEGQWKYFPREEGN